MTAPGNDLGGRHFTGTWRRYQQLALDAFDADRAAGDTRSYLVLPPGAGKTVIGLEAARRLGRRTLVLAPNTAVQGQWASTWDGMFGSTEGLRNVRCGTDRTLDATVTALTYQSIAVIDGSTTAEQRHAVLRTGDREALLALLHPNGRDVVERAAELGPWTLVLDECHHLLATWGALLRAIVDTLGPHTALIGLTATPASLLSGWQAQLRDDLFGPTDFEVATPALVKEAELAPYQELVYLVAPTPEEDTWLASERSRFADLQVQLVDRQLGTIPLAGWLNRRVVQRATESGVQASWGAFEQAEPQLARAGLRFAHAGLIPMPEGARLREQHRSPPDADDWVSVLSDFCLGHLERSTDPADEQALVAIKRVLPSLGYRLTKQGVRTTVSAVDRLCGLSEAKIAAAVHVLDAEDAALGESLRALVLCDFEQLQSKLPASLEGTPIDDESGSARLAFATIAAADVRGRGALRPLLVTGKTFACPAGLADELVEFCGRAGQVVTVEPLENAPTLRRIVGPAAMTPRIWVAIATQFFIAGEARVLVGTRALLGEGWDCPQLNVTVDLTTATTPTAITQMRGRSLRLDATQPDKLADNWSICCVTADHPRGDADYQRLVRKHDAYFSLTAAGDIESGVTHCDPLLSPFAAPDELDAQTITARSLTRVGGRSTARAGWRIGEPYTGMDVATVRIRSGTTLGDAATALPPAALRPALPTDRAGSGRLTRVAAGIGTGALASAGIGATAGVPAGAGTAAGLALLGVAAVTVDAARRSATMATAPSAVEQLAAAVADAMHDAGGADRGADAVRVAATPDGWLRCELADVPLEQSQRFATALDELMAPLAEPRHLVGRRVLRRPPTRRGRMALAARAVLGLPVPGAVAWHAVPQWCASNNRRLQCFLAAWERWVGPPRHLAADSPEGFAVLQLFRGEDPFSVVTQLRTVWS